jgi:PKD repeat protein|tara:strand:- start:8 stop:1480 length:1473 start_codon:yes stop_codon:yes gene_type:complete
MKKLFLFLFFAPTILLAQSLDVLFIGNSYTNANNLPQMVSELALSFGDTLNFESSIAGGATFSSHSTNINTLNKISQNPWDYVVLQAQSQEPSFSPNQVSNDVFPYAQILIDSIESNSICTEPIFFMTWGRKYGDQQNCQFYPPICTYLGMQQRLRQSYLDMTINHNATCSPVGICWKESIAQDSTLNLFSSDNSHPSIYGSYLAACTFYSTIFKKPSIGSDYIPNGIDTSTAIFLQTIASNTVLDSLGVWNIFNADFNNIIIGDSVIFTNTSSNYENVFWDFGDGYSSTIGSPNHTYSNTGNYDVTLVISTNNGCLSDTLTTTLTIAPFVSLCDSVVLIYNYMDTTTTPNLIYFDVQVSGFFPSVGYPGFVLLNNLGDTIAYENFNTAGNVFTLMSNAIETRFLDIIQNFNLPFDGFIHLVDGWFASNPNTECIYPFYITGTTSIEEESINKELLKAIDILGRESKEIKNQPLFYIYDDGTVDKKMIIE